MAEILGGIQTAEAITGLMTAVTKIIVYCKKLKDAHKTAERVLDRIGGLEATLESVKMVLEERKQHHVQHHVPCHVQHAHHDVIPGLLSGNTRAIFEGNIRDNADRCKKTVERIQNKLDRYHSAKGEDHIRLADRQKLVRNAADLDRLLGILDAHKNTLVISLTILNIYDHDPSPAHINVNIDVPAATQTCPTGQQSPTSQHATCPDATCPDADTKGDLSEKALEDLQPIRHITDRILLSRLAESTGDTQRQPDCLAPPDPLRYTSTTSGIKSNSTIRVSEPAESPPATHPAQPRVEAITLPDQEALKEFILTYSERGRRYLDACQYAEAETCLDTAIAYLAALEDASSIQLSQLVGLLENLARAKAGLRCWSAAVKIVQDSLLNSNPLLERSDAGSPLQNRLIIARHLELLASVYLDKYLRDPDRTDEDWILAHNSAQDAWKVWYELETCGQAGWSKDQSDHLHECLHLLVRIYKAKDMHTEAQYYGRQLRGRNSSVERSVQHSHPQSRPRPLSCITSMPHPADPTIIHAFHNQSIDGITALRKAVEAENGWTLIHLLDPAPAGCNISVDEHDVDGTALHFAAAKGITSMISALLIGGANIDAVDDRHRTPLFLAVERGDHASMSIILSWNDGKVDKKTTHDRQGTLLHAAVKNVDTRCTELLLAAEPELLDQVDRFGQTALHYCAESGWVEQAQVLMQHAATVNVADNQGRYPVSLALTRDNGDHEAVLKMLLAAGASPGPTQLTTKQQQFYDRIHIRLAHKQRRATLVSESTHDISPRTSRATSVTTTAEGEERRRRRLSLFRVRSS
ncbi:Ankyrin repeat domain-containing 23 [Lecanosticta acicola]|uniref:Ankyrin repeat domain-containing 23 n=1 Tax=Lecanosticta acicola TaxID=111012 RepID=A0AAI9E801_9PEZI|nr:Ankyrin repeat domain-containing 23 [Lecanosticta acicola]